MSTQDTSVRPTWDFLMKNKIAFVGFGFGIGLIPKAPGTWGSLLGMILAGLLLGMGLGKFGLLVLAVLLFGAGVWICDQTEAALGQVHDYRGVVWDEIVGMLLVFSLVPQGFFWWVLAFAAFRFFDIVKPQPIGLLDKTVRGGLGVMVDDAAAAMGAIIVIQLLNLIF